MELMHGLAIGGLLRRTAARFPDRPAIEYLGRVWTYSEVDALSDEIARSLLSIGAGKGVHVGIWANDRPNTLLCFYAAVKIGAVPVMLNTSLLPDEIENLALETDVDILIIDEGFRDVDFAEASRKFKRLRLKNKIYIGQKHQKDLFSLTDLLGLREKTRVDELEAAKAAVRDSDPDVILFTSGTFGSPKGVVTTHFSRVNIAIAQAQLVNATEHDKFLVAIPMFHCFSLSGNILAAMAAGACVYFPENRRTRILLDAIEKDRCTVFSAVPTLFSAILARPELDACDLSSLRTGLIGGSLYPPELFRKIRERMHFELLPSLGQTEATAGITGASPEDAEEELAMSVGHFLEHVEGEIRDPNTGDTLPNGAMGEVCIRGYNVMKGYYGLPELTDAVIDKNGWLHTGDLGYIDEAGCLRLTGRIKDLIIRGGENIAPGELECIIAADERVSQVKVLGVPDPHYIEEICACVATVQGALLSEDDVRRMISNKLAYYKVPKYVLFFDKLPLTGNGKIALKALSAMAADRVVGGTEV